VGTVRLVAAILCFFVLAHAAHADELATTASGRKVLLKDDGTWENAEQPPTSSPSADDYSSADKIIRANCQSQWDDDFSMLSYCIKQQKAAIEILATGKPPDISQDQFMSVRRRCAGQWATDFGMREYCEKQQFSAIRELKQ
jgi:hypothetical protein